jgi:serine protease Do
MTWPGQRSTTLALVASAHVPAADGAWTKVAKAAMPAVVNVASTKTIRGAESPSAPFFADPFFRFFPAPDEAPRRERSLGSGVIVTADGYALTNNHVVQGAQDIRVTLDDRRQVTAELVGADAKTDLAVLKLPASGLPVLPLADSDRVEVAEAVLAIGNPFGLTRTVTQGIVSAVGRANVGIADYEDFIQTDAAINPGNSGGALVNAAGGLIGINTAIFAETGGYMGIGFAVPVNMARQVMDQLVAQGKVTRGYLGLEAQELTPALAQGFDIGNVRGIVVAGIASDGPAASAGLRRGDIVTAVDGKPVDDVGHFRNLVAAVRPGTQVGLTLLRDGQEQTAQATVAELPERPAAPRAAPAMPDRLGLSLRDITPEAVRTLQLPEHTTGALVVAVSAAGRAADAGVRPGDVIREVNRQPVRSATEFQRSVEQAGTGNLVLLVERAGSSTYVAIGRS